MDEVLVNRASSTRRDRRLRLEKVGLYRVGKVLGHGNFATVRVAYHEIANVKVAMKIVDTRVLDAENLAKIEREIKILQQLNHPFIVRLFEVIRTESYIYIVMQYVRNGELFDLLMECGKQTEEDSRQIFQQLIAAVAYLHNNGVVHRDLKAENLLLDKKGQIKLIDFGFSNWQKPGLLLTTWCGSPPYAAPELLLAQEYDGRMSDIWSLGVILYILVTGGFPFPGDSVDKLKRAVMGGDRNLKIPFWVSVECADLIRKMLTISPVKRLSLAGIVNHRWFMAREMSTELMFLFQIGGISVPFKNKVTTSSPSKSLLTTSPSFGSCASKQAKLDPTILLHIQQHTGWTIEQVSEDVNARNFESPIFATYELLAAKLADLRAEENEILSFTCTGPSVTTSLQQQIENNQAAMRRGSRGSILSGRANVEPDVAQTTTVIPVHHLAKLSLSVGDDESDESSASDDRELVSPRYGTPSESGPSRHRRRRHAMTAFNPQHKPESSISAATKTPVVSHAPFNAFPFLPANPLLNAVAQQFTVDTLARAAATAALLQLQQQQQLVETAVTKDNGDSSKIPSVPVGIQHIPFMDYVRITALNMGNVQANPERRASANEALFGMNYAQHLLAAYSTMLGSATAGCGVNFAPGGITSGGERCVSSLAGGGTASPTMIQQPTGPRARKSVEEEGDRCAMEYTGGMRSCKRNTVHYGSVGLTSGLPVTPIGLHQLSSQRHMRSGPYSKQQGSGERRSSWAATVSAAQATGSGGLCISPQQQVQLEAIYRQSLAAVQSESSGQSSTNVQNLQLEFQKLCASQGTTFGQQPSTTTSNIPLFGTTAQFSSQKSTDQVKATPTISIIDENSQLVIPSPTSPLATTIPHNSLSQNTPSSVIQIGDFNNPTFLILPITPKLAIERLQRFAQQHGLVCEVRQQPTKDHYEQVVRMAVPLTREKDQPLLEERLVIELSFQPNEQQETGDTSDIRIGISLVDNNETEWYASHFRGLCAALAGALSDV